MVAPKNKYEFQMIWWIRNNTSSRAKNIYLAIFYVIMVHNSDMTTSHLPLWLWSLTTFPNFKWIILGLLNVSYLFSKFHSDPIMTIHVICYHYTNIYQVLKFIKSLVGVSGGKIMLQYPKDIYIPLYEKGKNSTLYSSNVNSQSLHLFVGGTCTPSMWVPSSL